MVKESLSSNTWSRSEDEVATICVYSPIYLQNKIDVRVNYSIQQLVFIGKGNPWDRTGMTFNDEVKTIRIYRQSIPFI